MNRQCSRPRLIISHGPKKKVDFDPAPNIGTLSPDLQPCSPPTFCPTDNSATSSPREREYLSIGKYVIHQTSPRNDCCTAVERNTGNEYVCKVLRLGKYHSALAPYLATDGHPHVVSIHEVILGASNAYVFFPRGYGDLHSYVRERKKLKQAEARELACQVIKAVCHCHENGVVLRDLKLRKFVFKNEERTELRLDGLDDAIVLEDTEASDVLTDKHGCPAYVSPEILSARNGFGYSGKCADLWSLGVMIYTMLVGRYPFHDRDPMVLFGKIRRGFFKIPEFVPARAKCLIQNLLRQDPLERLSASECLDHPWFSRPLMIEPVNRPTPVQKGMDQLVPDYDYSIDDETFELPLPN